MKAIIVGMGVQGVKRKKFLKKNFISSVDPEKKTNFKQLKNVPLDSYDSVYICTPDNEKIKLIKYALKYKKNILVEKPLIAKNYQIKEIENLAKKNKVFVYTAYNHRFEPSIIKAKETIKKKNSWKNLFS